MSSWIISARRPALNYRWRISARKWRYIPTISFRRFRPSVWWSTGKGSISFWGRRTSWMSTSRGLRGEGPYSRRWTRPVWDGRRLCRRNRIRHNTCWKNKINEGEGNLIMTINFLQMSYNFFILTFFKSATKCADESIIQLRTQDYYFVTKFFFLLLFLQKKKNF